MLKTVVVGATLALFMMSLSTLAFNAHPAKAHDNLLLAIEVDKTMMTVGECVNITLTLQNVGTDNITLIYGPPLFDVVCCTLEGCYRWSDGKCFIQIVLELTLKPGENYSETLQWDLYQYRDGNYYPPQPGTYYLAGLCSFAEIVMPSYVVVTVVDSNPLVLETDSDIYLLGDTVNFTLTNVGNETIQFGGWPFCEVHKWPSWKRVAPEAIAYLAWSLDPGQSDSWMWNATDTGLYVATDIYGYNCTEFFKIRAATGSILSDINGDGEVNIKDIWTVAYAFGSYLSHSRWNPFADVNGDYRITIVDLYLIAKDYGKSV